MARRVLQRVAGTLLVLLVAAGALYAVWVWSQSQYYVGASSGKVAIFQGVSQSLGPVTLSHADWVSTVDVEDLPDFYRSRVEGNVTVDSRADAQRVVESLAQQALLCIQKKAEGDLCGTGAPGESSTGTSSTGTPSNGTASTGTAPATTGRTP